MVNGHVKLGRERGLATCREKIYKREFRPCEKRKLRRIKTVGDANGLLISLLPGSANFHESTLVQTTIDACPLIENFAILIGGKASDLGKLDQRIPINIRLIAPK
jgi:hypothetical protein